MKARRAVVDTNVLISAALVSGSAPALVTRHLLEYGRLLFSQATFDELETRIWRPKFDRYLTIESRKQLLHDFDAAADWVELKDQPAIVFSRDADDDKFVHTALAGAADWLVSGDRDLLDLAPLAGLQILSPAQALEKIKA